MDKNRGGTDLVNQYNTHHIQWRNKHEQMCVAWWGNWNLPEVKNFRFTFPLCFPCDFPSFTSGAIVMTSSHCVLTIAKQNQLYLELINQSLVQSTAMDGNKTSFTFMNPCLKIWLKYRFFFYIPQNHKVKETESVAEKVSVSFDLLLIWKY